MFLKKSNRLTKGQSIAEWGLILALISVVTIVALTQWGTSLNSTTSQINNALNSVNTTITTAT